MIMWIYSVSF